MAICTHWEGKGIDEDGREEEHRQEQGRSSFLKAQSLSTNKSKLRTQRIISLSRVGWLLSFAAKYFTTL